LTIGRSLPALITLFAMGKIGRVMPLLDPLDQLSHLF